MSELVDSIRARYSSTLDKITAAAARVGRDPKDIKLIVVTKSQPVEVVRAAIEAGAQFLGENYPEEGVTKIQFLRDLSGVEWHMIGHVQSRKAQLVAQNFNLLHSLDGPKLANRLDRFCREARRTLPTLLEFNVGGEESKSGWPAWDEALWPTFLNDVAEILSLPSLQVRGLMAMPPIGRDSQFSRPFFQKLKRLQGFLAGHFPHMDFEELSMGTSLDFEVAVEEGATMVRVGTAILGSRNHHAEDR